MADTEYRRLLQAAKDRALFGFLAVVQRAMQDADHNIVEKMALAKSGLDQTALSSVRHFIRQDGNVFLRRIDELFRVNLDRAMQTMYVDMRPGMRKVSANELSLIDDDIVVHQIEVGRLTERMREANEESIGRLNVIVAQLHGQREARERENPFRPYLLARALYEATRETAADEAKAKVLFEHLASVMTQHLPAYYSAIREVFESSGVRGKFEAQRSRAAHNQRYFGAPPTDAQLMHPNLTSRVMPGLQRVLDTLHAMPGGTATGEGGDAEQTENVQDFIRKMFSPSKSFILSPSAEFARARMGNAPSVPVNPLVAQLDRFQKSPGEASQPSALREKIDMANASTMERMTVDVVALLFEFILDDDQIPAELRRHIGRLQIPMLKAAVLEPGLLQDEKHPARQLLNRMSTAAVGAAPDTAGGGKLAREIERIVNKVLAEFGADTKAFAVGLAEFEKFLADHLRQDDSQTRLAAEVIEEAERFSVLLTNATKALCDVLVPLNADKRVSDFIILIWPHVLVRAAWQDAQNKVGADQPQSLYRQYHAVLPELLWSIQEKSPEERAALMRMLSDLVKRLRNALHLIQLPDDESKPLLDLLVEMHTQVLRATPKAGAASITLDALRQDFSRLVVHWERASWDLSEPPQVREAVIEEMLARRGIEAELNPGINTAGSAPADREFLVQTYLLGTRVAFRAEDGSNLAGQLVWVSTHRSLYLFRQEKKNALVLYTPAALLEALREEAIVPVEYAPVFERAVESLLFGASHMQVPAT